MADLATRLRAIRLTLSAWEDQNQENHPIYAELLLLHQTLNTQRDAEVLAPFVNRYEGFRALRAEAQRFYRELARDVAEIGYCMDEVKTARLNAKDRAA